MENIEKEKQIKVVTYEQDRLRYLTEKMYATQEKYHRLLKKHMNAPYLSKEATLLSDAGRESNFYCDIVEMLENNKQIEGEWEEYNKPNIMRCSLCGWSTSVINPRGYKFCPNCGAKMKGGEKHEH